MKMEALASKHSISTVDRWKLRDLKTLLKKVSYMYIYTAVSINIFVCFSMDDRQKHQKVCIFIRTYINAFMQ